MIVLLSVPAHAADPDEKEVRASVVQGTERPAVATALVRQDPARGDISLNFPSGDVRAIAAAVLGDILHESYTVADGVNAQVAVVTPRPIARSAVLGFFEEALKASGLALVRQNGAYLIQPIEQARAAGAVAGPQGTGFGAETITLQFVNAEEMKKLLDPILAGVVTGVDASRGTIAISGTTGQRASARDLLRQFDVNWLRAMSFALLVPQRTDARLIVPELDKLINAPDAPTRGIVRIIAMEKLNGILAVTSQRQYLEDVRRWIEILDREGQNNERRLFVYRVQNGRSRDLARTLNVAFGNSGGGTSPGPSPADEFGGLSNMNGDNPRRGGQEANQSPTSPRAPESAPSSSGGALGASISSDEVNNAILVYGTPREYAVVEDALRRLDLMPQQVLIEAAITEVTLNNDLRYGVQWNFQAGDTNFALTDNVGPNPSRLFPGFSFFYSNKNDISATLNALEGRTRINVVSAPKLLVLNNQTAALQVGDQVPVTTQSSVGVQDPDSPIVNSVEYRDTGVILKVTPRVNANGLVLLDVSQEVSDVASTSTSNIDSPTIQTRRISTTIAVQDGQVIALGGLIRDRTEKGKSGLPLLSRLPLIGGLLFGKTTDAKDRTELIVLLKPRVLRTPDDARAVTDELRAKIRSIEPFSSTGEIP